MPTYRVTAPSGRVIRLNGDSPPTEQEINEVFLTLGADESVSAARKGAEKRANLPSFVDDYTGLAPAIPGLSQEERDKAMFEGYGQGTREAAPLAVAAALGVGAGPTVGRGLMGLVRAHPTIAKLLGAKLYSKTKLPGSSLVRTLFGALAS